MAYEKLLSLDKRVLLFAEYMLENKSTVRATAKHFGFSKSTVHKDLSVRLRDVDREMYREICVLLDENLHERHIRGGNATKRKYSEIKNERGKRP